MLVQLDLSILLPLGLFRIPRVSAATLIGWFINLTQYGAILLLGLYFQQVRGYPR